MGPALKGELEMLPGFAVQVLLALVLLALVLLALVLLVQLFDWAVLLQVQLRQGKPVHDNQCYQVSNTIM